MVIHFNISVWLYYFSEIAWHASYAVDVVQSIMIILCIIEYYGDYSHHFGVEVLRPSYTCKWCSFPCEFPLIWPTCYIPVTGSPSLPGAFCHLRWPFAKTGWPPRSL